MYAPPEQGWKPNPEEGKRKFLEYIAAGDSNAQAIVKVGRTVKGLEYWRKDKEFAQQMDYVRARRQGSIERKEVPDFPEFCVDYLGFDKLYWHQLQWFDILEGRDPRELHESQIYEPGRKNRILFNTPPNHGKTQTITLAYVVWRICKDPNDHIVLISKSMTKAKDYIYAIQKYLSHPTYRKLQQDFGPVEGWKRTAATWTKTQITLVGEDADGEKDPTVQVLGIGGQIYGVRANLIVLDDVVDLTNAQQFENQITWFAQEVLSRPGQMTGLVVCVGTRVAAVDFYSELRSRFPGVYTYFASPAVLEYADDVCDWRVLWPERLDTSAEALDLTRSGIPPASWARAYQQQSISDDTLFPADKVMATVDKNRHRGRIADMQRMTVIAGLDPATVGYTAAIVMAVDRLTGKRIILDAYNHKDTTPAQMRAMIHELTERYGISEWRVERNAFQRFLTQDEDLRYWLHSRGCIMREHYTHGLNKWDPNYGVESLETLFADALVGNALIAIPNPNLPGNTVMGQLVEQLVAWSPNTKARTDLVMALWFCEIKAREICRPVGSTKTHQRRSFTTRRGVSEQIVIDLEAAAQEKFAEEYGLS